MEKIVESITSDRCIVHRRASKFDVMYFLFLVFYFFLFLWEGRMFYPFYIKCRRAREKGVDTPVESKARKVHCKFTLTRGTVYYWWTRKKIGNVSKKLNQPRNNAERTNTMVRVHLDFLFLEIFCNCPRYIRERFA